MGWFPFFMDVSAMDGLIVGGGAVALRKIEKLLDYGARLTVCAPSLLPEIEAVSGLVLLREPFRPDLLDGKGFVIAATGDPALNHEISALCQERGIPVNVVDDRAACSFLFPALVKRGDLSIGISTGGASPTAAVYWKEQIAELLPENTAGLLAYLDSLRERVKESVPQEKARAAVFDSLFRACMEEGWPLDETVLSALLAGAEGTP